MRFELPRRKRRRAALTPLIDVVFLLLVFFMLATSFGARGSLPLRIGTQQSADGRSAEADADVLRIALAADGSIRVGGELVERELLADVVGHELSAGRERPVRVLSDDAAPLQAIATVLAELDRIGARDVALGLAPSPGPGH